MTHQRGPNYRVGLHFARRTARYALSRLSHLSYGYPMADVVLVHGAASTAAVWNRVVTALHPLSVLAPDRPGTGDLAAETDWLESISEGAVVFGTSGGATLVLELAARRHSQQGSSEQRSSEQRSSEQRSAARALIAHEPAVGSHSPEVFGPLAAALEASGVNGFGSTLYGPRWTPAPGLTLEQVQRDLAMFRSFEPAPPQHPHVVVTTGEYSPPLRHQIAGRLSGLGYALRTLPGASHFAAAQAPKQVAALIRETLVSVGK